jgi:hypothetical protein
MARNIGNTQAEKDLYEWNARVQITTWGNRSASEQGKLHDYAHKEWNGILKDFYYMRWKTYFDALIATLDGRLVPVLDWYAESIYQCFLPGEYEVEDGYLYPYGSWYMSVTGGMMDGTAYAPLVDCEIVITEADGIYTITLDAYDDNGFNISGVLSGVGEIYDEEGNPMQRQKSHPLSGKKTFGRKSMKIGKPLYIK